MADFKDLDAPVFAGNGWYVLSTHGINQYLHTDGQVHMGSRDLYYRSSGYFDTELDAHLTAERYYLLNGRKYPYTFSKGTPTPAGVCSQPMQF